jgi:hypothetical protein
MMVGMLVAACATPQTRQVQVDDRANQDEMRLQNALAFEGLLNDDLRLQKIAANLKMKAPSLCGSLVNNGVGFYALNQDMLPEQFREAAKTQVHIGLRPRVLAVYPGSAAEEAGFQVEDEIVAINDWTIPHGDKAAKAVAEKTDTLLKDGKPLNFKIDRKGTEQTLTLVPKKECGIPVVLNESDDLNAFADGKNVFITRGMMRFAQSDTELALVVSHEMAHNTMEHMKAKTTNYILGTLVDILFAGAGANTQGAFGNMAAGAYSQEFEAEADYVGMYIMAAAGQELDSAPKFWRRLAAAHPGSIKANYSSTHPSSAYRLLALDKTVQEIKDKQARGATLTPEMKHTAATPSAAAGASAQQAKAQPSTAQPGTAQPVLTQPVQTQATSLTPAETVSGNFNGKEIPTTGLGSLVKRIGLKFTLTNLGERAIAEVEGKVRLLDDAGKEIGTVSIRSAQPIPAGESLDIVQYVYPLVFSGYAKLRDIGQDAIQTEFEFTSVKLSDGSIIRK